MFATLKKDWPMTDATINKVVVVPEGRHELERIPNSYEPDGEPWLVKKGTKIGMLESDWRSWQNGICTDPLNPFFGEYKDWGKRAIIIEE